MTKKDLESRQTITFYISTPSIICKKIDFNNINVTVILLRKKYFSYDIKGFDGRYRISDWLSISLKQVLYVKNRCTFGLIECCNISGG